MYVVRFWCPWLDGDLIPVARDKFISEKKTLREKKITESLLHILNHWVILNEPCTLRCVEMFCLNKKLSLEVFLVYRQIMTIKSGTQLNIVIQNTRNERLVDRLSSPLTIYHLEYGVGDLRFHKFEQRVSPRYQRQRVDLENVPRPLLDLFRGPVAVQVGAYAV